MSREVGVQTPGEQVDEPRGRGLDPNGSARRADWLGSGRQTGGSRARRFPVMAGAWSAVLLSGQPDDIRPAVFTKAAFGDDSFPCAKVDSPTVGTTLWAMTHPAQAALVHDMQRQAGMTNIMFDPSRYTRPPIFTLLGGITLAEALRAACPSDSSQVIKKSLQKLDRVRGDAQSAWREKQRALAPSSETASQEVDKMCDRGWAALRARLYAYSLLPQDVHPKSARAAELLERLFPNGLEFTQRIYVEQLAAMDSLIQRIAEEKLDKELASLCGPEFLDNVERQLPRYRAMVQGGLARAADAPNLTMHLKRLSQAIAEYSTKVAASVDGEDEASVRRAVAALSPIDRYREAALRRSGGTGGPVDPAVDPSPGEELPSTPPSS